MDGSFLTLYYIEKSCSYFSVILKTNWFSSYSWVSVPVLDFQP